MAVKFKSPNASTVNAATGIRRRESNKIKKQMKNAARMKSAGGKGG